MDTARCHNLAERLHALLLQQLGMGLDVRRMQEEPLYARDVLLVCAAHPGTELARLAWEFRDAAAPAKTGRPRPAVEDIGERRMLRPDSAEAQTSLHAAAASAEPEAAHEHTHQAPHRSTRPDDRREGASRQPARPSTSPSARPTAAQPEERRARSALSRFSLSRFGASIFGGSLFEGTLFGGPQADPVTDFGDDSYLAPAAGQTTPGSARHAEAAHSKTKSTARRSRWFGR